MQMSSSLLILALLTSSLAPVATAQEGDPRFRRPLATEIRGVISVRGCTPAASDLDLRALPVNLMTSTATGAALNQRTLDISARVSTTTDPHVFSFTIGGLRPYTLYQLSLFTPPSPVCGTVFWRHPTRGLVVSGDDPVQIEGIAATTSLELQQPGTDEWVGIDTLDFTDARTASRKLRWRSLVPDVIEGELQISTRRFPTDRDFGACDEPDGGVVYRQTVPAIAGRWTEIDTLNFSTILEPLLFADPADPDSANPALKSLLRGAPLYVRIVPQTSSGPACDAREQGVPGWIIFVKVPPATPLEKEPEPGDEPVLEPGNHIYRPPVFSRLSQYQPEVIFPTYGDWGYRVVKDHQLPAKAACSYDNTLFLQKSGVPKELIPAYADPMGCLFANRGHLGTLASGLRFVIAKNYSIHSGNTLLDSVVNLVTAGYNTLGVGANFLADLYNDARDAAEDLAYDVLLTTPGVQQYCSAHSDQCKKGIEIGVTYALASMGLPPTAPNWDDLDEEGIDYLAAMAGEEIEAATGIPSEIPEWALKELAHRIIDDMTAKRGGQSPQTNWFVVGDIGLDFASWNAGVKKNGLDPVPLDMTLFTYETPLYGAKGVALPHKFPAPLVPGLQTSFLHVPIVLPPNVQDVRPPICVSSFYRNPVQQCVPNLFAPVGAKPTCLYHTNADFSPGAPLRVDEECIRYGDLVAIYYRDAWAQKIAQTPCTLLAATTLGERIVPEMFGFDIETFVAPGYTFVMGAAMAPMVGSVWSGKFVNACP